MALGNVEDVPLQVAVKLRAAGYRTSFNVAPRSLKAQFKSVDRSGAKVVVIVGESELAEGKVNVKHIATQMQTTVEISHLVETVDNLLNEEGE